MLRCVLANTGEREMERGKERDRKREKEKENEKREERERIKPRGDRAKKENESGVERRFACGYLLF